MISEENVLTGGYNTIYDTCVCPREINVPKATLDFIVVGVET